MSVLEDTLAHPAFAVIRRQGSDQVVLLGGDRLDLDELGDIQIETGPPPSGRQFDRLVAVPFAQIRERGFAVHQDGAPLSSIEIRQESVLPVAELLGLLPDEPIETVGALGFDTADDDYADTVRRVIEDEIGNGEGANVVIARSFRATIKDWGHTKALTVLRRLLEHERGAYWTSLVFTGDRYLVGASPERHVSVHGGAVRMNPISGTFRFSSSDDRARRKARLLQFLADDKEIFELFMVVDEELKMMCHICDKGGQILGPFLKPMTHLIHTEYVLAGRTTQDVRAVLRDSMFAATVTGSPVENACRLITKYEATGRGYYAGLLALIGRDVDGTPTADAPILLRTADIGLDGQLRVTAGATLVRDSDPQGEVAETHAKAAGILTAFGLVQPPATSSSEITELVDDEDVTTALESRNRRLAGFWFDDQYGAEPVPGLAGRHVIVLDGEDDFVAMLQHMVHVLGMTSETIRHDSYFPGAFDRADVVIVGPGPGDPRQLDDPKIKAVRAAVEELLTTGRPFLAVCLGHQVLAGTLGLQLTYKDIVFQGTQTNISAFGRRANVGFYNTFVAKLRPGQRLPAGVTVDADPMSGDVHALVGPHYIGVQFHAESILSEHGFALVREQLLDLLRG